MERLKKIIADVVFVVQILIGFILIFENRIEIPPLLQTIGRVHPLFSPPANRPVTSYGAAVFHAALLRRRRS